VTVDLETRTATSPGGTIFAFDAPELLREMLLRGQDQIAVTLSKTEAIERFRSADRAARPWAY